MAESRSKLTVAQIIRGGTEAYIHKFRNTQASWHVQGVLAKLSLCRTEAMGDRWYRCDGCHELSVVYNSCGDRHCPQCRGAKRSTFCDRASKLLLENVDYYQVVFTLPDTLSRMALANRMPVANLLFKSAWKSLNKTIRDEHEYDPAAMMVLHTWNQQLDSHWHVHCVVPGGGPSLDGTQWNTSQRPGSCSSGGYLVDAVQLRTTYRKIAIAHLKRLYKRGELQLDGEFSYLQDASRWKEYIETLESKEWGVCIEPPPHENSKPENVVRYLARYLTGGPINDARILAADDKEVTFLARAGRTPGGDDIQVPVTLPVPQFVQRWCMHIQPNQLTKTRYFGGWSNTRRLQYLLQCSGLDRKPSDTKEADDPSQRRHDESTICPHCGEALLRSISRTRRPSWRVLLKRNSLHCPDWYRKSLIEDDKAFWDALLGGDSDAWWAEYTESRIEVARLSSPPPPPAQLLLPGVCLSYYD